MALEIPADELVQQLSRVGLRLPERLVNQLIERGTAVLPALIELATDVDLLEEDEPTCWGPVHALRLLGELPDPMIIKPLLECMPIDWDGQESPASYWVNDIGQIMGRVGAAALPLLWEWADDESQDVEARGFALNVMVYVTAVAPETREQIIAGLRERLAREASPQMAAQLVNSLGGLSAAVAYNEVMAAYRVGRVDREFVGPAAARQMLLGSTNTALACVRHPFWERYTEHGPQLERG